MQALTKNARGKSRFDANRADASRVQTKPQAKGCLTPKGALPAASQTNGADKMAIDTNSDAVGPAKNRKATVVLTSSSNVRSGQSSAADKIIRDAKASPVRRTRTKPQAIAELTPKGPMPAASDPGGNGEVKAAADAKPDVDFPFRAFRTQYLNWLDAGATQRAIKQHALACCCRAVGYHVDNQTRKGTRSNSEKQRLSALWKAGTALLSSIWQIKPAPKGLERIATDMSFQVSQYRAAWDALGPVKKQYERQLTGAVRTLPIAAWAESIKKLGSGIALVTLVAESQNPGRYANPGKLVRRFGLAPYNGKSMSVWVKKGGLTADEYIANGYSGQRRARLYVVGGLLRMGKTEPYYGLYRAEKVRAAALHPDWTKLHIDRHACRVMDRELVIDFWCAWHGEARRTTRAAS